MCEQRARTRDLLTSRRRRRRVLTHRPLAPLRNILRLFPGGSAGVRPRPLANSKNPSELLPRPLANSKSPGKSVPPPSS